MISPINSPSKRLAVYERAGYACAGCGYQFRRPDGYDGRSALSAPGYVDRRGRPRLRLLEIDHIHPRRHGGTNDLDNLQPLCTQCNVRKGAKV